MVANIRVLADDSIRTRSASYSFSPSEKKLMSASQSSKSDANNSKMSFRQGSYGHSSWSRSCNCGRSTTKIKSWTDDNPERRFFRCDVLGFVSWSDDEKQCGWQKLSLLEARDELKVLKESLRAPINQQAIEEEEETKKLEEEKKKLEEEKKKLEAEKKTLEE